MRPQPGCTCGSNGNLARISVCQDDEEEMASVIKRTLDWGSINLGFDVNCTFKYLALLFQMKKICKRKKAVSQGLIPSSSIYIHMCTLYTHTNTYIPRVSPTGFLRPFRCCVTGPTPGLTSSTQCAVRVWVCVYTHIHNTLPPSIKNREDTRQHFYLSVCPKNSPR